MQGDEERGAECTKPYMSTTATKLDEAVRSLARAKGQATKGAW